MKKISIASAIPYVCYGIALSCLFVYSYCLVDPNLTLISHPIWVAVREPLVYFGYYMRVQSWWVFASLILILTAFHIYFVISAKHTIWIIVWISIAVLWLSYPFLSRDLFNYMFDAKILTYYHQNPYFHKALDFPADPWLRFMHWTHRSYPYGPTFLPLSLIPSIFSGGRFFVHFALYKLLQCTAYLGTVYCMYKINKKAGMFFATSPLVLIEGLVNAHNDLFGVFFAVAGFLIISRSHVWGRVLMMVSGGIKYFTAPFIVSPSQIGLRMHLIVLIEIILVSYVCVRQEVQPWYFLTFAPFFLFYSRYLMWTLFFTTALLFSYCPFILYGSWDALWMKHIIIICGLVSSIVVGITVSILSRKARWPVVSYFFLSE